MDATPEFAVNNYVAQEQLLFGIDQVWGGSGSAPSMVLDFSHDQNISHRVATSYVDFSTSPEFQLLHQAQSVPAYAPSASTASPFWNGDLSPPHHHHHHHHHHTFSEGFHGASDPASSFISPGWASPSFQLPFGISPSGDFPMPSVDVLSTLSTNAFSNPVDIPINVNQIQGASQYRPASTDGQSFFSQSSWADSFAMSRTESITSYSTSFEDRNNQLSLDPNQVSFEALSTSWEEPNQFQTHTNQSNANRLSTSWEEPPQVPAKQNPPNNTHLSTSPFSLIQYQHNRITNRLAPDTTRGPGRRRPRGRTGPLNDAQRRNTARMREIGACKSCRDRKAKCDSGIPCKQCINYYKSTLTQHPCRGQQLEDIADKLLQGHIFPRKREVSTYLGESWRCTNEELVVYLELGFGQSFAWPATVVCPDEYVPFAKELVHEHVNYDWPEFHGFATERTVQKHLVFPAVLAKTGQELKAAVDKHLTNLVDDEANFVFFPLYQSPLEVLKHVYEFYRQLGRGEDNKQAKSLLGTTFKLLNLIHIGGDTRIASSASSRQVLDHFFAPHVREQEVTPCFIRGQLGEVFSELASEYMKEVLSKLEAECLNKNYRHFPLIVSTFMVLFMAVESIQYHTHKDTFHFAFDGGETSQGPSKDELDGMVDLLGFYKNCFAGWHRDRLLSVVDDRSWTENSGSGLQAGENVLLKLRIGIQNAKDYLVTRSKESLSTRGGDITVFFDRLVARLLLLEG